MANVHIMDHPLIHHKLAVLRNKETPVKEFRELINEISGLMCYEATRNLPTKDVEVETPVAVAKCKMLSGLALVGNISEPYCILNVLFIFICRYPLIQLSQRRRICSRQILYISYDRERISIFLSKPLFLSKSLHFFLSQENTAVIQIISVPARVLYALTLIRCINIIIADKIFVISIYAVFIICLYFFGSKNVGIHCGILKSSFEVHRIQRLVCAAKMYRILSRPLKSEKTYAATAARGSSTGISGIYSLLKLSVNVAFKLSLSLVYSNNNVIPYAHSQSGIFKRRLVRRICLCCRAVIEKQLRVKLFCKPKAEAASCLSVVAYNSTHF